jgi:hypothetical protein
VNAGAGNDGPTMILGAARRHTKHAPPARIAGRPATVSTMK